MLKGQKFARVRLWPRGVDLSQFGPSKRCAKMRASWGVGEVNKVAYASADSDPHANGNGIGSGTDWRGRRASFPLTPPLTPFTGPIDGVDSIDRADAIDGSGIGGDCTAIARVVLLYVGRISWEKNLHLLLAAYARLPAGTAPKLVFVGDGPARVELEAICAREGHDAVFMGHRSGAELAQCYASADVFAFPSFTEVSARVHCAL